MPHIAESPYVSLILNILLQLQSDKSNVKWNRALFIGKGSEMWASIPTIQTQ